jgi:tape measure domain-containing protein
MATTINLANIALGFDASKITRGVDLSAGELRKLGRIVQDSVTPIDRYNRDIAILERAHNAGALSAKRHAEALEHLNQKYKQTPQQKTNPMVADLKSTLAQYAGLAVAFRGIQTSMSLAATAESNKISLEVLTGSAEKARFLFEGFIALDRSSPLSRQDFSKAAQTLVGYGLAAEQTMPALRALSEVSIGNADRFQSLALAFGQVQANGRLMGQEVLQMVNAGFNPLQEISRTTGTSMLELKKQMENGAISSEMVADAFKSATSEGGRFFEMNERLKNSAAGQYAKMKSDVELLATEIGTNLLPAAKSLMEIMNAGANSKGQGGLLPSLAANFSAGIEGMVAIASDAITNLDEDSVGTKFDDFLARLGKQEGERQMEALKHVLTPAEQAIREKNMAAKADTERKELQRIANEEKAKQSALDLYTKEQQELQRKLDVLQLGTAEVEYQENLKKGLSEQQASELRDLQEKLELEKSITEDAEKRKKMDSQTKDRIQKAEKDFDKLKSDLKNDNPNNIAAAVAPALRAGSVEAYRFLMNQRNEAAEIAQEQAEIAREQLVVQQQQLEAFQSSQMIGIAGRTA